MRRESKMSFRGRTFTEVKHLQCYFCVHHDEAIDYKNTYLLNRFISGQAKIYKRERSGLCSKHQRKVAIAIKRARIMALLPFVPR